MKSATEYDRTAIKTADLCFKNKKIMFLDKEHFDSWMRSIAQRLDRIEKLCDPSSKQIQTFVMDGEKMLDNYEVCQMLNISKRTLQRYRSSGDLPYHMNQHKTYYKESDILLFIERNFDKFRNIKKK